MSWKKFTGEVEDLVLVRGDDTLSPTRWWNRRFLRFRSKSYAVLNVPDDVRRDGYRVGFCAFDGVTMVSTRVLTEPHVRIRRGRENCVFFVIGTDGKTKPMRLVGYVGKADKEWSHAPLI